METIPTTSRSLDRYYHINGDTFEKRYKEILSGYRGWSELSHAEEWLVFPENIGESICIDETAPSNGELFYPVILLLRREINQNNPSCKTFNGT